MAKWWQKAFDFASAVHNAVDQSSLREEESPKEKPAHQFYRRDRVALNHVGVDVGDVVFDDVVVDAGEGVPDAAQHPPVWEAGGVESKEVSRRGLKQDLLLSGRQTKRLVAERGPDGIPGGDPWSPWSQPGGKKKFSFWRWAGVFERVSYFWAGVLLLWAGVLLFLSGWLTFVFLVALAALNPAIELLRLEF